MATWHKRKKEGLDLPQCENAHPLDAQLYELSKLRLQSQTLLRELSIYCHAHDEFDEAAQRFIKAIDDFDNGLVNDADPDVVLAKKGAQKLHGFLERYHTILSATIRRIEEEVLSQVAGELETLMDEPKVNRKELDKSQSVLEVARKKYRDTVASKKTTPAKIHEAQEAQERAKDVFTEAESRTSTSIEKSNEILCSECPRLFLTLFRAQEKMFHDGLDLVADNRSYFTEFDRTYETNPDGTVHKRVVEVSAQAQSLEDLVKAEKQIALELSVLTDIREQMMASMTQLRITKKDIDGVFQYLNELVKVHRFIIDELEVPLGETESVATRVSKVITEAIPKLTACYVPFSKAQGEIAFKIKQLRKSKQFVAFLQQFEQNLFQQQQQQQRAALAAAAVSSSNLTGSSNGLTIDLTHLITQACRHAHTVKMHVQKLFDTLPSEDEGWGSLHTALGKLSDLLDRVDDLLVETEHTKQLLRIKAKIPALDEAITDNPARVFLFDSEVAIATTQGFKDFIPVSAENPNATSSSAKKRNMMWLPNHLFLFNDYLVVTERDDSAAPVVPVLPSLQQNLILDEDEGSKHKDKDNAKWRVIGYYPVYDLTVEGAPENEQPASGALASNRSTSSSSLGSPTSEGSKRLSKYIEHSYSYFRVRCGDKCSTISVGSKSHQMMWLRVLSSAISDRRRNQVFGVPIPDIMSRETEAGRDIPNVFEDLITAVETPEWVKSEGLYRISSSVSDVLRLQGRMDAGKRVQFTDAHSSANALKLWIRQLPEPLLGRANYDKWWHIEDVETARMLISQMPPSHVPVLAALLKHMINVAKYEEFNKMGISNLSILFTPSILPQPTALNELIRPAGDSSPLPFLIDHFDEIFTGKFTPMTSRPRINSLAVRSNTNQSEQLKEKLRGQRSRKNERGGRAVPIIVSTANGASPLATQVTGTKHGKKTSGGHSDSSNSRKNSDASEGSDNGPDATPRKKKKKSHDEGSSDGSSHQHKRKKSKTPSEDDHVEEHKNPEAPKEEEQHKEEEHKEEEASKEEETKEEEHPKEEEVKEEEVKEEHKEEEPKQDEGNEEEAPKPIARTSMKSKTLPDMKQEEPQKAEASIKPLPQSPQSKTLPRPSPQRKPLPQPAVKPAEPVASNSESPELEDPAPSSVHRKMGSASSSVTPRRSPKLEPTHQHTVSEVPQLRSPPITPVTPVTPTTPTTPTKWKAATVRGMK